MDLKDYYFDNIDSNIFREARKELIDEDILFEDYEEFNVEEDSRKMSEFKAFERDETIFHADIETTTDGTVHRPYLICWDNNEGNDKHFEKGVDCVKKFLNYIKKFKNPTVKFQNLGYDVNFIIPHISYVIDSIEPSKNKVYSLRGVVYTGKETKKIIRFVDQYPQNPYALSKYKDCFKLEEGEGKMQNFAYHLFTNDSIKLKYISPPDSLYNEFRKYIPKEYFFEQKDKKGKTHTLIKHWEYAIDYCQQDVETQRKGWNAMHKNVLTQTGLDYNNYITISSLSKAICKKEKCYEGVYEISGKTGLFIRKCVIGGRTMASLHNKEDYGIHILNEREEDDKFNYEYEDDTVISKKDSGRVKFIFDPKACFNNVKK